MGSKLSMSDYFNHFMLCKLYKEFDSSINITKELNPNKFANRLLKFCLSEEFEFYLFSELDNHQEQSFINLITIYEFKEKYLSIKIFFFLMEQLKNEKFDDKLREILRLSMIIIKK